MRAATLRAAARATSARGLSSKAAAKPINATSARITQPKSQGASQAMLHATGMTAADLDKAQVGISSMWYEGNPCNMHLLDLARLAGALVDPDVVVEEAVAAEHRHIELVADELQVPPPQRANARLLAEPGGRRGAAGGVGIQQAQRHVRRADALEVRLREGTMRSGDVHGEGGHHSLVHREGGRSC